MLVGYWDSDRDMNGCFRREGRGQVVLCGF
jgi:hypothetical protein